MRKILWCTAFVAGLFGEGKIVAAQSATKNIKNNLEYIKNAESEEAKFNYQGAIFWYEKSANLNDARSMYKLGSIYEQLDNYSEERRWFEHAANLHYIPAISSLGIIYNGDGSMGVPPDHVKAVKLFLEAAHAGDAQAMNNLGVAYYQGNGVTKNINEALHWWSKAVDVDKNGASGRAAQTWLDLLHGKGLCPNCPLQSDFSTRLDKDIPKFAQGGRTTDTTSVEFSLGAAKYRIPRNYLYQMTDWSGGPQQIVSIRATYPDLKPFNDDTKACVVHETPCRIYTITLHDRFPAHEDGAENAQELAHPELGQPGPYGFTVFEYGVGGARHEYFRKIIDGKPIMFFCIPFDISGKHGALCDHVTHTSSGATISYFFKLFELRDAIEVDESLKKLVDSFSIEDK